MRVDEWLGLLKPASDIPNYRFIIQNPATPDPDDGMTERNDDRTERTVDSVGTSVRDEPSNPPTPSFQLETPKEAPSPRGY